MSDHLNEKSAETCSESTRPAFRLSQEEDLHHGKKPLSFRKAFLLGYTGLVITIILCVLFSRHPEASTPHLILFGTIAILPVMGILLVLCLFLYHITESTLNPGKYRSIHTIQPILYLAPLWGIAILFLTITVEDRIWGATNALSHTTDGTVTMKEIEDFRDLQGNALKCSFTTVYFRTTPKVVERLLLLHKYEKQHLPSNPQGEEERKYLKQKLESIEHKVNLPQEGWPNIHEWDGVEVFSYTEEIPPRSHIVYYLITDKDHRQVILERDGLTD